ncbi:DUF483 domain-containing protein [Archaeoglobus profundus]|nr:DUF483 domain-containing protein [Archaeoglobus profundus]
MLNPSVSLELVRIEAGVSNCIQAVLLSRDDLDHLRRMGYSVITYRWLFDPITLSLTNRLSFYICKERTKALDILKRIESLEKDPTSNNVKKMIMLEGKLLGYPKCCTKSFSQKKIGGKSPEKDVILDCIDQGVFVEVLENFPEPNLPEKSYSLFTMNFYPCKLDCKRALNVGRMLVEYNPKYRYKIVLNVLNLLVPVFEVYKSFKHPKTYFGEVVHSFVESLGDLKRKAESIVNEFRKDPVRFEIDYLRRYA